MKRATFSGALGCAAIAGAIAACAWKLPPVPSQGGPAWTELVSEHFTLWTDASPAHGRELIAKLEHLEQIVYGVAFTSRPGTGRSFVIALADREERYAFLPNNVLAFAVPGKNPSHGPFIMIDVETADHAGYVVTHELTHVISAAAIRNQPVWFAEGLAQFFETTSLDPRKNDVDVGEFPRDLLLGVRRTLLLPGDELFACKRGCDNSRFYVTAAVLYQYLANERMPQLLKLQDELATGNQNAWAAALPDLPPEKLVETLRAWLVSGKHRVWHFHVALDQPTIQERALGDGDVWAARALIRTAYPKPDLDDFIARAIAADPTSVLARLVAKQPPDTAVAHAVMAAHPDDWRAWYLLIAAKVQGVEYKTAMHQMCTLAARDAATIVPDNMCASYHPPSHAGAPDAPPAGSGAGSSSSP